MSDFSKAEDCIKENPKRADALASEWQNFINIHKETSPEILSIQTEDEFYVWAAKNSEKNIDASVWTGKEIIDAYCYLRESHEDMQMSQDGEVDATNIPPELIMFPFLAVAFLQRPRIMQDDGDYKKIEEKLKKVWLKKNPGKDFNSEEGIDYLYGKVNYDPLGTGAGEEFQMENDWENAWAESVGAKLPNPTLAQEAEQEFRNNPKFAKKIARYDKETKKIYKSHRDDPHLKLYEKQLNEHIKARMDYIEKHKGNKSEEEITILKGETARSAQEKAARKFISKHPEKARAYSEREDKANDSNFLRQIRWLQKEMGSLEKTTLTGGGSGGSSISPSPTGGGGVGYTNNSTGGMGGLGRFTRNRLPIKSGSKQALKALKYVMKMATRTISKLFLSPWFWSAIITAFISVATFLINLVASPFSE